MTAKKVRLVAAASGHISGPRQQSKKEKISAATTKKR
jgi:hypothetical protein